MDFINILYFLVAIICLAYYYIRRVYGEFERNGIPYIKPTFPFGSAKGIMEKIPISEYMQIFYNQLKDRGPFGGVFFMIKPAILATDLEFIKKVLIKDFAWFDERGGYYNKEDDPLSAHLFSLNGKEWRKLRSKLSPTFTSGKMKFMYPTIIDVANRFKTILKETVGEDGQVIEIKEVLARFTTDVIGTCAFGIECNSLSDPNAKFLHMGRKIFVEPRHKPFVLGLIDSFPKIAKLFRVKMVADDLSAFFMKLVEDTVDYREKNNIHRNDFMDILIRLKNEDHIVGDENMGQLTLNEIAAQAFVFFLAGFETSSTAMAFSLYELAMNRELQEKARNEIRATLDRHDGQLTYEAVNEMEIVDQILNGKKLILSNFKYIFMRCFDFDFRKLAKISTVRIIKPICG